jgi:hypothetical protein
LLSDEQARSHDVLENIGASVVEQLVGRRPDSYEHSLDARSIAEIDPHLQGIIVDGLDEVGEDCNTVIRGLAKSGLRIVWTTRVGERITHAFGDDAEYLNLHSLTPLEAFEYFGKMGLIDTQNPAVDARELVQELGGLPLALAVSSAYIKKNGCSITDYLSRFRNAQKERASGIEATSTTVHGLLHKALKDFSASEQVRLAELCIAAEEKPVSVAEVKKLWFEFGGLSAIDSRDLLLRFQDHSLILIQAEDSDWKVSVHKLVIQLIRQLNLESKETNNNASIKLGTEIYFPLVP